MGPHATWLSLAVLGNIFMQLLRGIAYRICVCGGISTWLMLHVLVGSLYASIGCWFHFALHRGKPERSLNILQYHRAMKRTHIDLADVFFQSWRFARTRLSWRDGPDFLALAAVSLAYDGRLRRGSSSKQAFITQSFPAADVQRPSTGLWPTMAQTCMRQAEFGFADIPCTLDVVCLRPLQCHNTLPHRDRHKMGRTRHHSEAREGVRSSCDHTRELCVWHDRVPTWS